jgi:uncharacterized membrane protein
MAISLPANVTSFLTAVKASLSTDRTTGTAGLLPPSYSPLRAQDLANVLRLLQVAAFNTGTMTAAGNGTTTTFVDGASTFVASTMIGNTVTFASDTTTAALRGVTATIRSNTTTTLTFNEVLPAATATGDTLVITGTVMNYAINALMENKSAATSAPAGDTYAKMLTAQDALCRLTQQLGGTLPSTTIMSTTALAGTSTTSIALALLGVKVRVDEFKGMTLAVNSVARKIISNTEDGVILIDKAITAPSGGESAVISIPETDITPVKTNRYYAGRHGGDNYKMSALINAAQAAVLAFTLPS